MERKMSNPLFPLFEKNTIIQLDSKCSTIVDELSRALHTAR
jgi:hypothetical protein